MAATYRRAVVLGGSVAGLCAAGAVSRYFDEVIVIERDVLPADAKHRRGVPQSKHPHFLLNSGRRAIEQLYPGFEKALIEAGGVLMDPSLWGVYCEASGWAPRKAGSMTMIYSSRILVERVLRDRVRLVPNVVMREGASVIGLETTGGGRMDGRVSGARIWAEGVEEVLAADLVIDALGRGSKVSDWVHAAGWEAPQVRTLDAKASYSSRWYQKPASQDLPSWWWWKQMSSVPMSENSKVPHPVEHEYLCTVFPIEADKVIITMGSWGHEMPKHVDDYESAATRTYTPLFAKAMQACQPLSDVHFTRSTGNKWRCYDNLENHPLGLVTIGDAICAFNPLYGQGISSAARSAVVLAEQLSRCTTIDRQFHDRFLAQQRASLQVPWSLAIARDRGYACAEGTETASSLVRALTSRLCWPFFSLITAASRNDSHVEVHFGKVFNLDESLRQFVTNPRVIFGLSRFVAMQKLGRARFPYGFDHRVDPPETNYTPGAAGACDRVEPPATVA